MCSLNPASRRISNHWISLHEHGHVAGMPILVMEVWEHAYLLDDKPSKWVSYIEAFFCNIDWQSVERRLRCCAPGFVKTGREDDKKDLSDRWIGRREADASAK